MFNLKDLDKLTEKERLQFFAYADKSIKRTDLQLQREAKMSNVNEPKILTTKAKLLTDIYDLVCCMSNEQLLEVYNELMGDTLVYEDVDWERK